MNKNHKTPDKNIATTRHLGSAIKATWIPKGEPTGATDFGYDTADEAGSAIWIEAFGLTTFIPGIEPENALNIGRSLLNDEG